MLGANAQGQPIPYPARSCPPSRCGRRCFFGNLFNDEGLFVGNDQALLGPSQSSLRACALEGTNACPPLVHIGSCQESCTLDPTSTYYTQCTRNGVRTAP